jgi:hypothetical protein
MALILLGVSLFVISGWLSKLLVVLNWRKKCRLKRNYV